MKSSQVKVTHPERVVDSESGATKQDVVNYYQAVSDLLYPYLEDRLVSVVRCPEGVGGEVFFQRHPLPGKHQGLGKSMVETEEGPEAFLTIEDPIGILDLCQYNMIEFHPWGSHVNPLEFPDRIIFDLDPDPSFRREALLGATQIVVEALEGIGLRTFLKLTGGKGVHVVSPIIADLKWDVVKEFARVFSTELEKKHPELFVTNLRKAARKGRIFLDYLRNGHGSTAVAPYCLRARPGLPISIPIEKEDLERMLASEAVNISTGIEWIRHRKSDPWKALADSAVSLRQI